MTFSVVRFLSLSKADAGERYRQSVAIAARDD